MSSSRAPSQESAAELHGDIQKGRTGDKRPGFDPAAAPLGTDAEAAGSPPTGGEVARAREHEDAGEEVSHDGTFASGMRPFDDERDEERGRLGPFWLYVGIVVIVALAIALTAMFM